MSRLWLLPLLLAPLPASAQLADTLLTWRTYSHDAVAHVRLYASAQEARPVTVVIDELAASTRTLSTDDARFLAETIGRTYGRDPAEMTFVFRIGADSFCRECSSPKRLLLRATFTRTGAGRLSTPNWRVITRDELASLTDRALF